MSRREPASPLSANVIPATPLQRALSGSLITGDAAVDTSATLLTPGEAWARLQQSETYGDHYYGFAQHFVWMGFTLANKSDANTWYLEVANNHINHIRLYSRVHSPSGLSDWFEIAYTGRTSPFSTRPVPHFNFVFDLDLAQQTSSDFVLLLDKRRSSINYPVRMWTMTDFNSVQQRHYAYFGLYFGIFGIVVLTTLVAFLFTLQRIYFWYLCYVMSVGLFVFVDIGLAHQYLYPESSTIGGASRIGLSYLLVFTFNMFTMSYFRTRDNYPLVHRLFWILCAIIIGIAFTHAFFTSFAQQHVTYILYLLYFDILASISLALWVAFKYLTIERNTAILFILAFSFIFVAGTIFIMSEFGLIQTPDLLFTPIQIGSVMEIVFLSFGLAWQVRFVEKRQIALADKVHRLENEKLSAYIQGTEKERSRVAAELHDNIGSKLGQLRRTIESGQNNMRRITRDVQEIVQDVRVISQKLAPPGLKLVGLAPQIERLVLEVNQSSTISYTFQSVDVPDDLPEDITIQLFRIVQEGLQNIEKHSQADKAEIQLICHSDQLVLTIDDNGKGFDLENSSTNGIGLDNIRKRVSYMKGEIMVTSVPGTGTEMMITVPVHPQTRVQA
ncbi:7TM diverse intracellular signaling domain-containing protein [Balneolales bacterium ANBcel1]|nr:7TM diverse intracellular signaling domain-containing protein [Balneolales bacterium ANBcel1]